MKKSDSVFRYDAELDGIYRSGQKNFYQNTIRYTNIPCKVLGCKNDKYLIRILHPTARKNAGEEIMVLKKNVTLTIL